MIVTRPIAVVTGASVAVVKRMLLTNSRSFPKSPEASITYFSS